MARPTGWDILGLSEDPTPGVLETVQDLAKQFGDFAHDVQAAYRSLNSFATDATALEWVGKTADAFKGQFGPLPGRLQKLYTSHSEASDALSAFAPALQSAQSKADSALRQAQDAHVDLQRAQTTANTAADDLKTAQQNHAANPNPQAVTDAQTAHDTAQTTLKNAQAHMAALAAQANQAHDDLEAAGKVCAKALHHAQSDGIHNKHWWEHVGEFMSEWGGKIAEIANDLAPFLDVLALATSWIPGVDVITAGLAEADNIVAMVGTGLEIAGDAMQGHWGDALMGAGMLGLSFLGGKAIAKFGGKALEGLASKFGRGAEDAGENAIGSEARKAEGLLPASKAADPVDVVSGWMLTDAVDLDLPGTLPLVLRRAYASGYDTGRLFGPGWASTLDQRLSINAAGIHFAGDDGQRLDYPIPDGQEEVLPERGSRWPLIWDRSTDEIRITDPWSGLIRHFSAVHYGDEFGQIRDLTLISDRNGNRIDILRDEVGTPTGLEHPGYRVAVDTVATAGGPRLSALRLLDEGEDFGAGAAGGASDAGVVVRRYSYDQHGRLIGVINSSGKPYVYEWDETNRIRAWQDRAGYRYVYHYDHLGRVVSGEGAFLAGTFTYDAENRTTVHTDSLGQATTYVYDEHGHVTSEADPLGNVTITVFDQYGRLLSRTDATGQVTEFVRDEAGDVRQISGAAGVLSEFDYNEYHQIVGISDSGARWRRDYDERGNLEAVTDPAGAVTRLEHLPDGALTAVADPTGVVTRFTTDKAGLPVAVWNAFGDVTAVVRDSAGRVRQLTDPAGAVTTFEWNADGLMLSRSGPDGARTRWQHNADGRLLREINPVGATMVYEPGPLGTLVSRTSPDGVRHTFTYDSELRLREILNPSGASWRYEYDGAGRLVHETDFIGRTLAYSYDPSGRLISRTTGSGQQIGLEYDRAGRLAARRTPEGDFRYDYNANGTLAALIGPGGSTLAYEYDQLGRLLAETIDGRTTRHSYDAAGRRLSRTTPSGAESTWTYDGSGRPVGLATGSGSLGFVFDTAGREIERHFGREAWLSHRYDAAGRPVSQQLLGGGVGGVAGAGDGAGVGDGEGLLSREWMWRPDGVPAEIHDSVRGTRQIRSDAAGRVTAVSAADWSETYAYDVFGNVASQGAAGIGAPDSVSDALAATLDDHGPALADRTLIRRHGRTHLDHDAAGRLVRTVRRTLDGRRQIWEYTWDSADRLVQVVTPDRGTWRYTYDPIGRRTAKYRLAEDGAATDMVTFSWDGVRLAEQSALDGDGVATTLTWDYDPGTFRPAAQRRRTGPAGGSQDEIDEAFWGIVTDLVGTPTELVGPDGRVAWQTTVSLWGRTTRTVADPGVDCPLRFPGQYHDPETGLYYNLQRYYDPDTAGYLSPDPWGLAASPNDHAYVGNPLTSIDPLGLYESIALGLSKEGDVAKWADANGHHNYMDLERDDALASVREFANERPDKDIHILLDGFRMHSGKPGTLQDLFEDFYKRGHISQPWLTTQREMNIVGESVRLGNRDWSTIHFWNEGKEVTSQLTQPNFTALREAAMKL